MRPLAAALGAAGLSSARPSPAAKAILTRGSIIAAMVVMVDQLTKAGAHALGDTAISHPITNDRFSLGLAGGPLPVMIVITVVGIVAFGAYVVAQAVRGRLPAWVPALLVGGAVSNLVDRLALGAVRDFLVGPGVLWNLAALAVLVGIAGYAWGHLRRHEPTLACDEEVKLT